MTAIQAATSSIRSAPCIALPPNASPARLRASPRRSTLCPHPRVAVLLGGDSAAFSFPPDLAASFGVSLAQVTRDRGGSLLVTPVPADCAGGAQCTHRGSRGRPSLRLGRDPVRIPITPSSQPPTPSSPRRTR